MALNERKFSATRWGWIFGEFWQILVKTYILLEVLNGTVATCIKPELGSNTYTLSEDKALYAVNDTYEIYCAPGYITSGANTLICQATGSWSADSPACTNAEGTYPWWMLLVAVLLVVLLISCILPRLLQCCLKKRTKKRTDEEKNNLQRTEDDINGDYEENIGRSLSPVPNFGKDRKSNMDFMTSLHKDADLSNLKRANKNARF